MLIARRLAGGFAELLSLGLFLGMIWLWAALLGGPQV